MVPPKARYCCLILNFYLAPNEDSVMFSGRSLRIKILSSVELTEMLRFT
jgi:hypothetical protein